MDPKETPTSPNFTASPLYPHYPSGMTVNSPSPLLTDAPYAWMPHCDTSIPFTWMTNQLDSPSMSSTGVRTPDLPTCDSNCDNPDSFLALHNTVSPLWPSSTVSEDAIHATFDSDHKQQQLNWTSCAHDPFYESYCLSNSSLLHMPFPETFDPTAYEALVVPSEVFPYPASVSPEMPSDWQSPESLVASPSPEMEFDSCYPQENKLASASALFGHLSRAELIERVVQLEKERQSRQPLVQEEKSYVCRWANCGIHLSKLNQLITHIKENHVGSGKPAYHCEWSDCPRNQKPFMKRHKMHNHMRTHTGERPFVCTVQGCDKRFSRPDSLNTHIKTHSNVRPYACPVRGCGKAYFHSRSLRKHGKSHETPMVTRKPLGSLPKRTNGQVQKTARRRYAMPRHVPDLRAIMAPRTWSNTAEVSSTSSSSAYVFSDYC